MHVISSCDVSLGSIRCARNVVLRALDWASWRSDTVVEQTVCVIMRMPVMILVIARVRPILVWGIDRYSPVSVGIGIS